MVVWAGTTVVIVKGWPLVKPVMTSTKLTVTCWPLIVVTTGARVEVTAKLEIVDGPCVVDAVVVPGAVVGTVVEPGAVVTTDELVMMPVEMDVVETTLVEAADVVAGDVVTTDVETDVEAMVEVADVVDGTAAKQLPLGLPGASATHVKPRRQSV